MLEPSVSVSEGAASEIQRLQEAKGLEDPAIRVEVRDLAGRVYTLRFVPKSERADGDVLVESHGVALLIDSRSAARIDGARLEFAEELNASGFRLDNPNRPALSGLAARVQEALDTHVNPMVAQHGGQVLLMDVDEGRVRLEFGGGCQGCGMVDVTLKQGVETMLREAVPEIKEIVDETDHEAGENPYYQPGAR
ncbi:MAG: NifU family protein [Myxococcota bacterium]